MWTLKFYSQNRGSPKAFFECFWDLNGRFFIFKRCESRFGRKIPKSALFYCEKLSQSFRRFLVRYAEPVESHYSRLVRHFYFPDTINKESEMMPMKKITFNALLNHKAHNYKPMQIEVEKVIPLYGKRFEQMKNHPLDDCPEIIENGELMYMEGNTAHCILFLDANGSDGILVEAEGSDYARKSQFIPNARAIVEANDITAGERQLHAELKAMADRIAELAHTGQKHFIFEDMLGDEDLRVLMIRTVAEMLDRREDLAEVRDHYLGIRGQADFTVTAKPAQEMKLYCPLEIQAEPQIYETDWDAPYEDDLEVIPSSCACGCEDEINAAIEKYSEPEEKHRGLMIYYNEDSPVNEKVISAFPSVEVRNGELVGVLTCQITEPLTDSEMSEFQDWWTGQAADGYGESIEQKEIKTDAFGTIYVSFWNSSDSWQIETEMTDTADIEEEASLDMGGISM